MWIFDRDLQKCGDPALKNAKLKVIICFLIFTQVIFGVYASHPLGDLHVSSIAQFIIIHTCLWLILLPSHYPLQNLGLSLSAQTLNITVNVFTSPFLHFAALESVARNFVIKNLHFHPRCWIWSSQSN